MIAWKSVKEKPPDNTAVLVVVRDRSGARRISVANYFDGEMGWYMHDGTNWLCSQRVTHWAEMPDLPKEET